MATSDQECVVYARECARLAQLTQDTQLRDQLLDMARDWMATAMHEDGRRADAAVDHPMVLQCAARTEECRRTSITLENDFAASQSADAETLHQTRESIARSHQLLSEISARNGK